MIRATPAILRILASRNISVVHINNLSEFSKIIMAVFFAKTLLRPWFSTLSFMLVRQNLSYIHVIDRVFDLICILLSDAVIAVSHAVKNVIARGPICHRALSAKVHVIYNGIDTRKYNFSQEARVQFRDSHGLADSDIVIGNIGRLSAAKGSQCVGKAFADFKKAKSFGTCPKLFFIGEILDQDSGYVQELRRMLSPYSKNNDVVFMGKTENLPRIYSGLDIVVSASSSTVSESFGLTLVEAMACRRVVVGAQTGGILEIIEDGKNGFMFRPDDPSDLCLKFAEIVEKWEGLDHVRDNARDTVMKSFSLSRMIKEYNTCYSSLSA